MNKLLYSLIGALAGFSAGYVYWHKKSEKKYAKKLDDELNKQRDVVEKFYKEKYENDIRNRTSGETPKDSTCEHEEPKKEPKKKSTPKRNITVSSIERGKDISAEVVDYSKQYAPEKSEEEIKQDAQKMNLILDKGAPYVISPEEFANSTYSTKTLYYYEDDVLADDDGEEILNYVSMIGPDALKTFGQFEQDAVYVRSDIDEIDYEILKKPHSYHSANPTKNFVIPEED